MSGWKIEYVYVDTDINIEFDSRNVTGTALTSASRVVERDEGYAVPLAGVYRFTMESANTVSCAVMNANDYGNPMVFSGTKSVTCDGSTENLNLLPGMAIVLAADAEADDVFEIGIGCYWDSGNSLWVRVMPRAPVLPGWSQSEFELKAENISGYNQVNTTAVATNAARVENDQSPSRPFYSFRQVGKKNPTADSDLTGRAVTFDNYTLTTTTTTTSTTTTTTTTTTTSTTTTTTTTTGA